MSFASLFATRPLSIKEISSAIEANKRQLLEWQLNLAAVQNNINQKEEQIKILQQWAQEIEDEAKPKITSLHPQGISPLFDAFNLISNPEERN